MDVSSVPICLSQQNSIISVRLIDDPQARSQQSIKKLYMAERHGMSITKSAALYNCILLTQKVLVCNSSTHNPTQTILITQVRKNR
jgi:hypothetical protein